MSNFINRRLSFAYFDEGLVILKLLLIHDYPTKLSEYLNNFNGIIREMFKMVIKDKP